MKNLNEVMTILEKIDADFEIEGYNGIVTVVVNKHFPLLFDSKTFERII